MRKEDARSRRAAVIDKFGGPKLLDIRTLPIPALHVDEILIRVRSAGVGVWDPYELEGGFANTFGKPTFPYVLGSEGAGTVAAVGSRVRNFKEGDHVYGYSAFDGRSGFYADHALVKEKAASLLPKRLSIDTAGALPVDAMTALWGLDDSLGLKAGESVLIFGASGGIGHLAVQLAKRMGASVFAVASGSDGVSFVKRLGVDAVIDGRKDDVVRSVRQFKPDGLDTALLTAGGKTAEEALASLRKGGRLAYPNGVEIASKSHTGLKATSYDGIANQEAIGRLNRLIEAGPFEVHVARAYALEDAKQALEDVAKHHLGKLALTI